MNKKILFGLVMFFLLVNVTYALEQKVYLLDVKYDNGIITKENIKVIGGESPDRRNQPEEGYLVKVVSFGNETLYSFKFNFSLQIVGFSNPEWFDENGTQIYFPTEEESGQITLTETTLTLVIPYFSDAEKIEIYSHENESLLEVDVGEFASQGNEISEIEEQTKKTGQKIQTYFKEDKTGKTIKYIIYFMLGIMVLILIKEGIIKIMDKYRLMKIERPNKSK